MTDNRPDRSQAMTTTRAPHNAGQTVIVQQISPMPVKDIDFGPITVRENWGRLFISWKDQEIIAVMQHYPALIGALQHFVEPAALATPATEPKGYVEGQMTIADFVNTLKTDDNVARFMNQQICCDGHMCGCMAATVGEYLDHCAQSPAARPAPQPAADTRVVPLDRLQAWLDCLVSSEIKTEIRAIIGNATPAPSDKIAEAAQLLLDSLNSKPQSGVSHYWALAFGAMAFGRTSWEDFHAALRALAGKGE